MIPGRDHYADKNDKLTDDPEKFAAQVAAKGCFLDDRIAKRYGITDVLVSTDEPSAPRKVRFMTEPKPEPAPAAEPEIEETTEAEPEAEEPTAAATTVAKKDTDKGSKKIK